MNLFKNNQCSKYVIDYSDPQALHILTNRIQQMIDQYDYQHWVVVCIGTDRSTGDSLGPLVGSKLRLYDYNEKVFGTLDEPVHALNLQDTIDIIQNQYPDSGIIAIDASLGQLTSVGTIQVVNGPLKPGAGVQKNLPEIGHFHITGIVNVGGFMEYFVLQNTRLSIVMKMADLITHAITNTTCWNQNSATYRSPSIGFVDHMIG
ncbi:spore protease YyaC [Tepidibacillus sp. HK-1]|uniref:spore protease YyaC n=1 Tax=Tepidibacillus sp. HK-1 TaxID=1883407 RepID=UPI000852B076|nr:spore protease YyaC [Tepidibacillus sp. HK-1]GBF11547.1 germination protease [Tepidibacillus sp. HK-1]